jgi:hypothetical protein
MINQSVKTGEVVQVALPHFGADGATTTFLFTSESLGCKAVMRVVLLEFIVPFIEKVVAEYNVSATCKPV